MIFQRIYYVLLKCLLTTTYCSTLAIHLMSLVLFNVLLRISHWCNKWLLSINSVKCESMRITRSKAPTRAPTTSIPHHLIKFMHINTLESYYHLTYLGKRMYLQLLLKLKTLGLLKRTFGKCSEAIITGYKAMVRPVVEYVCPVLNPPQQYLSHKLEKIQRNVERWILGSSIEFNERLKYPAGMAKSSLST